MSEGLTCARQKPPPIPRVEGSRHAPNLLSPGAEVAGPARGPTGRDPAGRKEALRRPAKGHSGSANLTPGRPPAVGLRHKPHRPALRVSYEHRGPSRCRPAPPARPRPRRARTPTRAGAPSCPPPGCTAAPAACRRPKPRPRRYPRLPSGAAGPPGSPWPACGGRNAARTRAASAATHLRPANGVRRGPKDLDMRRRAARSGHIGADRG